MPAFQPILQPGESIPHTLINNLNNGLVTWQWQVNANGKNLVNLGQLAFAGGGHINGELRFGVMGYLIVHTTGDQPTIQTYGSKPLSINPIGNNVGIGTANSPTQFCVAAANNSTIALQSTSVNASGEYWYLQNAGGTLYIGQTTSADGAWGGWVNRVAVSPNGNVGIGTPNPLAKLDVRVLPYSSNQVGGILMAAVSGEWGYRMAFKTNAVGIGRFAIDNFRAPNTYLEHFCVNDAGQVGIGTSAPDSILHVAAASNQGIRLVGAGGVIGAFYNTQNDRLGLGTLSNHPIAFYSNNSEKARLTAAGAFCVGTITPAGQAHVATNLGAALVLEDLGGGTDVWCTWKPPAGNVYRWQAQSNGKFAIYDQTAAAWRLTVNSSGNVGIGTTNPQAKLHVAGGVQIDADACQVGTGGNAIYLYYSGVDYIIARAGVNEMFRLTGTGGVKFLLSGIPSYANNAAAVAGGLTVGQLYRTGGDPDQVCIVH